MNKRHGWYFISTVRQKGKELTVRKLDTDAVFAESGREALKFAAARNPLRPGEEFATTMADCRRDRTRAIEINGRRTEEIAELQEILDFRCGLREPSS